MNMTEMRIYTSRIINKIEAEKREYEHKYKIQPRYVKLPVPVYAFLEVVHKDNLYKFEQDLCTIVGLKICPTYSITNIDEIEVF